MSSLMPWANLWTGMSFPRRSQFVVLDLKGAALIAHLVGPNVGPREAPIIAGEVAGAMESLNRRMRVLVLDFAEVAIISSIGLGMFVDLCHKARDRKARALAYGVNKELAEMFRLMKIDKLFTLVKCEADLKKALAA